MNNVHLKCVTVRRDILLGIKHETRYHQYDPTEPNLIYSFRH